MNLKSIWRCAVAAVALSLSLGAQATVYSLSGSATSGPSEYLDVSFSGWFDVVESTLDSALAEQTLEITDFSFSFLGSSVDVSFNDEDDYFTLVAYYRYGELLGIAGSINGFNSPVFSYTSGDLLANTFSIWFSEVEKTRGTYDVTASGGGDVPEPASLALAAGALGALALARRPRRRAVAAAPVLA